MIQEFREVKVRLMLIGPLQAGKTKLTQLLSQHTFANSDRRQSQISWVDRTPTRQGKELSTTLEISIHQIVNTGIEIIDTPGIANFPASLEKFQKKFKKYEFSWKAFSKTFVSGTHSEKPDTLILVLDANQTYVFEDLLFYVNTLQRVCMYNIQKIKKCFSKFSRSSSCSYVQNR